MIQPVQPSSADFPLVDQLVPRPSAGRQTTLTALFLACLLGFVVAADGAFMRTLNDQRHLGTVEGSTQKLEGAIGARYQTNLAALPDGRVFQWGGREHNDGTIYDPSTGKFEAVAVPDFAGRFAASTVALDQEEVLVWGGQTSGLEQFDHPTTGLIYNTTSKTWRESSPAPAGMMVAPTMLIGDEVLIAGGQQRFTPDSPSSFLYNPTNDSWTPIDLDVHVRVLLETEGRILGAGPTSTRMGFPEAETWQVVEYNRSARTWTRIGSTPGVDWLVPISVDGQVRTISERPTKPPQLQVDKYEGTNWTTIRESERAAQSMTADPFAPAWFATSGDALYIGGEFGFTRYDYATNRFELRSSEEELPTTGGSAVWTGQQLVSLAASTRGWQFDPE